MALELKLILRNHKRQEGTKQIKVAKSRNPLWKLHQGKKSLQGMECRAWTWQYRQPVGQIRVGEEGSERQEEMQSGEMAAELLEPSQGSEGRKWEV